MAKRRARVRAGAKNDCLVDWSSLTPEVLEVAGQFLQHHDLVSAASVCKRWREALLSLLVRKLRVLLADVSANPGVARTTRSRGRFTNITRLLNHATHQTIVEVVVSERWWPRNAQVQAFLSALTRRPAVKELRFRVVKQLDRLSAKQVTQLAGIIEQLCAGVASTQQLTSIVLECSDIKPHQFGSISSSLAQLPSLQHLTLRGGNLALHHLAPITSSLTNLTSLRLTINDASSTNGEYTQPEAVLQQLALLSRLETLQVDACCLASGCVTLPPLPHLKHLHFQPLELDDDDEFVLLLSAEHCAQLESLNVPGFQAAAGVASVEKLQRLHVMYLPATPAAQQQAAPHQSLDYPQLRHIRIDENISYGNKFSLQQLAELLQQAPAVDSIHMHSEFSGDVDDDDDTALLVQTLSRSGRAPLRSLRLPRDWDAQFQLQLVALAAQRGQLQQLTLHEPLPPAQIALLGSITSLRDLNIRLEWLPALPPLPPELTALSIYSWTPDPLPPPPAQPQALPLRRLETDQPAVVLQALCMRQLSSSLTRLQCRPRAGMAQQLAGLAQLRSLKLATYYENDFAVLAQQLHQLGALTQLRELDLASLHGSPKQMKELVVGLEQALPNCIVLMT